MVRRHLIIVLAGLLLTACGATFADMMGVQYVQAPEDADAVAAKTEATFDPHQQTTAFRGPRVFTTGNLLEDYYFLRGNRGHTDAAKQRDYVQLYINVDEDRWIYYDRMYTQGYEFPLLVIKRELIFCSPYEGEKCSRQEIAKCGTSGIRCAIEEHVAINISNEELERLSREGLEFQLAGYSGKRNFHVPAGYFAGFWKAMEQASIPGAAAN